MTGVNFQTNTFEFNTQALDGQTLVQARTVDDAPLDDPQAVPDALQNQVYVSDAPAVGLINVDTSASSSELGATGNRAIRWLWISGNTDGLLEVAIVDAITRRVMEVISGPLVRRSYYRSTPFLVPQGALLRVTGLTGEVLVRFNVTDDDQCCVGVSISSHDDSICCSEVFAVSPPEIGCPYQSIQEAIDAAFAYSQQFDAFGFVHVLTGTYEEDVSAARGVIVRGEFGSVLKGTLTIDLGPGVSRDDNITAWVGVDIEQASGPGVHFTGENVQAMLLSDFSSETANGSAILVDNTGTDPDGEPSFIDMNRVTASAITGNPAPAMELLGSVVLGNEVTGAHEDVDTGISLRISSPSVGGFFGGASAFEGRIVITDSIAFLRDAEVVSETVAAIQIGDAGICIAQDTVIDCDVSPAVDGTGVFAYANIIFSASPGIAGTLAFVAPQAVQGSENLVYAATPASWAGAAPTRQQDATSRLAAFVAANIGPIT